MYIEEFHVIKKLYFWFHVSIKSSSQKETNPYLIFFFLLQAEKVRLSGMELFILPRNTTDIK